MNLFENFVYKNGEIVDNSWVEWNHERVPNKPKELRALIRYVLSLAGHCLTCTSLDGCYFVKSNTPPYRSHKNCDCYLTNVKSKSVKVSAIAECDLRKFTEYIFTDNEKSKGKLAIFESLGYNKYDSVRLKDEYEKQALDEYLKGNYTLKDLDENGQRVAIRITLNGKKFFPGGWLNLKGKYETQRHLEVGQMNNLKIIKFKTESIAQKHEKDASTLGIVLTESKECYKVLFFNVKNVGDYAVFDAPKNDFIITDYKLPQDVLNTLNEYLSTHSEKVKNKRHFENQPFCDSDYVELVTDNISYLNRGIKQGDKGIVIHERAVKNSILVDFSKLLGQEKIVSVNINDLRKVNSD